MSAHLHASLITSFHTPSTVDALKRLQRLEDRVAADRKIDPAHVFVDAVDLYCFGRQDPKQLLPRRPPLAGGQMMKWLSQLRQQDIADIAAHLTRRLRARGQTRRAACLATNLPCISCVSSDSRQSPLRRKAIQAVQKLVRLAHALGVGCVEIVGGANFVRTGRVPSKWETQVGSDCARLRREALLDSLVELETWIDKHRFQPPVGLALELEPGLSYGLNSGRQAVSLLADLDQRIGHRAQNVAVNIDLGHAWLISELREPDLRMYVRDHLIDRIAHAHLSLHVKAAHFADLRVSEEALDDHFRPWIDLFSDSQAREDRPRFATATIGIEQESAIPQSRAVESFVTLRGWLVRNEFLVP
jgi:sugar phosphate isomerase/epimerase